MAPASCAHCGLPVGNAGRQREVGGEDRAFCCYGCSLAYQFGHGGGEEPEAAAWLIRVGLGAFLAMNIMTFSWMLYGGVFSGEDAWLREPVHWLLGLLATPLLVLLGGPFFAGAWQALREGRLVADTLVALGVLSAYGYSAWQLLRGSGLVYFDTATMVLLLFTLGCALEAQARARAARSLAPMLAAERAQARVVRAGEATLRPLAEVRPGDFVRVLPGERLPVDGVVVEGRSECDESVLTGQPLPRPKAAGATVWAGSLNGTGLLLVRATTAGLATRWVGLGRMVREALAARGLAGDRIDRVAAAFVPGVLLLAAATAWYWAERSGSEAALLAGLAVLVVACPCSLGLAAPLAGVLAIGRAARRGVLVRGGAVLERLARVRVVAFDKTGTLTGGSLRLVACTVAGGGGAGAASATERDAGLEGDVAHAAAAGAAAVGEGEGEGEREREREGAFRRTVEAGERTRALRRARALALGSDHPVAQAVVQATNDGGHAAAAGLRVTPGAGLSGHVEGVACWLGSQGFLERMGCVVPADLQAPAGEGGTFAFVGWDGQTRARLDFAAEPAADAALVVARLHDRDLATLLLSGDGDAAVRDFAAQVGIEEWRAGLNPEDKVATVRARAGARGAVAMVGDGLNDGPVLASAAVGIAVGEATDFARESADVVLPRQGLAQLPWLLEEAARVQRSVRANLVWAFGYNAVALALAASGLLRPVLAAALMAGSSVVVVARTTWAQRSAAHAERQAPAAPAGVERPMKRRRVLLALAACLTGAAGAHHAPSHPRREDLVGWPMPPFALLDHHGRPFTHERLRLRWTFLLFGATHGGGACDDALAALAALHVRLAPTQLLGNTQVVFVSLDPERDSPRRLREYLSFFDARFVGVTGAAQALGPLVHDLGLDAATGAGPHGRGTLLLVGPDAVVRAEYLPPFQVPRLVAAYVRTRRGLPP